MVDNSRKYKDDHGKPTKIYIVEDYTKKGLKFIH